jgi:hypothetical protein
LHSQRDRIIFILSVQWGTSPLGQESARLVVHRVDGMP